MKARPPQQKEEIPLDDARDPGRMGIEEWWNEVATADVAAFLPKFQEYGSNDLVEIGRTQAAIAGWEGLDESQLAELGIFFYLYGKMARWAEALADKRWASDDTLHDVTVYSMMARRNRAAKGLK